MNVRVLDNGLILLFILNVSEDYMAIPISKPSIGKEEIRAATEVLMSGNLAQGKRTERFEKDFSKYVGTKFGAAVSSGTSALQLGLQSLGLKKGDEVITTPFTFAATANAILHCGAKPVFSDIDSRTLNIDPVKIIENATKKTKAILCVHLYGQPCDMAALMKICDKEGLLLVEDAAQAIGAEFRGKKAGSFGMLSAFSFYATKNITTGEGGMVLTNSEDIDESVRILRNHGQTRPYRHDVVSFNFRMTDIQAAIGIEQLKKVEALNRKRAENAKFLTDSLSSVGGIETPFVQENVRHVFHQYTIRVLGGRRDRLLECLGRAGVGARVYYPDPVYAHTPYAKMGYKRGICPVAEKAAREVLSLPVHPALSEEDLRKIVQAVRKCA